MNSSMNRIKKRIMLFCMITFIATSSAAIFIACSKKPTITIDPYAHITAKNVYESCKDPTEFHPIQSFSFPLTALVVRHSDCLGIKDMMMVVWSGKDTEKNRTAAKLLVLMYTEFQNTANSSKKLTSSLIKVDQLELTEDNSSSHMSIYSLKTENLIIPTKPDSPIIH